MRAILHPQAGEDAEITARPRAVLAAQCLADEPNVGPETVLQCIQTLGRELHWHDGALSTSAARVIRELAASRWAEPLCLALAKRFCSRFPRDSTLGLLCGKANATKTSYRDNGFIEIMPVQKVRDSPENEYRAICTALTIMVFAWQQRAHADSETVEWLLAMLKLSPPAVYASAWALGWLSQQKSDEERWHPSEKQLDELVTIISDPSSDQNVVKWLSWAFKKDTRASDRLLALLADDSANAFGVVTVLGRTEDTRAVSALVTRMDDYDSVVQAAVAEALGRIGDMQAVDMLIAKLDSQYDTVRAQAAEALGAIGDARAVEPLIALLDHDDESVWQASVQALGQIGDARAVETLLALLDDDDSDVRTVALESLAHTCDDETDSKLLSRALDALHPFLDVREEILEDWVEQAAEALELSPDEIRQRYEALAQRFPLKLAWKPTTL